MYRWTYNRCCELVYHPETPVPPILAQLRLLVVNERGVRANFKNEADWVLDVPHDWRDKAVVEFVKAYETQRFSIGRSLRDFTIHHKSRKALYQVCEVDPRHWHGGSIFSSFWKRQGLPPLQMKDSLRGLHFLDSLSYSVKLMLYSATRQFYLCVPEAASLAPRRNVGDCVCDNQAHADIVFIDPGVRTFLTCYDTRGRVVEFGLGYDEILRLCLRMDKLASAAKQRKQRTRYRILNHSLPMLRFRLKNMIHDFHLKVAKFLCNNYSDIHLPIFESSRMLKRDPVRCINSRTARMMCTWSHYKFQQLLLYRALITGSCVHIANEAYTSRTCSRCGFIRPKTGSKSFVCPSCDSRLDRDVNAAINIMLRQCSRC